MDTRTSVRESGGRAKRADQRFYNWNFHIDNAGWTP
jgi:hypothetical protein